MNKKKIIMPLLVTTLCSIGVLGVPKNVYAYGPGDCQYAQEVTVGTEGGWSSTNTSASISMGFDFLIGTQYKEPGSGQTIILSPYSQYTSCPEGQTCSVVDTLAGKVLVTNDIAAIYAESEKRNENSTDQA